MFKLYRRSFCKQHDWAYCENKIRTAKGKHPARCEWKRLLQFQGNPICKTACWWAKIQGNTYLLINVVVMKIFCIYLGSPANRALDWNQGYYSRRWPMLPQAFNIQRAGWFRRLPVFKCLHYSSKLQFCSTSFYFINAFLAANSWGTSES